MKIGGRNQGKQQGRRQGKLKIEGIGPQESFDDMPSTIELTRRARMDLSIIATRHSQEFTK